MVGKKQHFIGLKNPQHQQQELMCIPACIKTILDNQFNLPHKISLSKITEGVGDPLPHEHRQRYPKFIPKGIIEIQDSLRKILTDYAIIVKETVGTSKDNLLDLIAADIYPMVYLDLESYYKYRGSKTVESDISDSHCVIVVGYGENEEIFGLWDPLDSYEKKEYSFDNVRKIDYKTFLSCWDKTNSRGIYLFEKSKQKKLTLFQ